MAKIDPKTAKKMYSATNQASKDKIAKELYGEFGFDTLKYEEQELVYKNNPGLQRGEGDKSTDFKGPLYMLNSLSPFNKSRCWKGFAPVPGKKAYSKGSCKRI